MATPVEAPKLGNTVEECILFRWAKHPRDAVAVGELVAEIETDKAAFELTAPVEGTVLATFFEEGALVPVFTNAFVIGKPGEDAEAFRPKAAAASPSAPPKTVDTAAAAAASAAATCASPKPDLLRVVDVGAAPSETGRRFNSSSASWRCSVQPSNPAATSCWRMSPCVISWPS